MMAGVWIDYFDVFTRGAGFSKPLVRLTYRELA